MPEGEHLVDLTDDAADGGGLVAAVGSSEDASRVYFVASGVLATGGIDGQPNLYLWQQGQGIRLVATLDSLIDLSVSSRMVDEGVWARDPSAGDPAGNHRFGGGVRTSRDGRYVVFRSKARLTGYDTAGRYQLYRYDAFTDSLVCVSCNPRISTSSADAFLKRERGALGRPVLSPVVRPPWVSRNLLADGSVVFETTEALVPGDVNGRIDVYEWDDGQIGLISSGVDSSDSSFLDASESGEDVFFVTRAKLVESDTDNLVDLYDARIGGGLPDPPAKPECQEDACQGVMPVPPVLDRPVTGSAGSGGNAKSGKKATARKVKCKKGFAKRRVRGKVRCAKKTPKRARRGSRAEPVNGSERGAAGMLGMVIGRDVVRWARGLGVRAKIAAGLGGWLLVLVSIGVAPTWAGFGMRAFDGSVTDQSGGAYAQAGGHPFEASTTFEVNTRHGSLGYRVPDGGQIKTVLVDLPAGFVGNPTAQTACSMTVFLEPTGGELNCPESSQLGVVDVHFLAGTPSDPDAKGVFPAVPVYNLEAPPGVAASFGFIAGGVPIFFDAHVSSVGGYHVQVRVPDTPQALSILATSVTLWGVPASPAHTPQRGCQATSGVYGCAAEGAPRAFITNPTSCPPAGEGLRTELAVDSWDNPGVFFHTSFVSHNPPGYVPMPFDPTLFDPTKQELSPDKWGSVQGPTGCESFAV